MKCGVPMHLAPLRHYAPETLLKLGSGLPAYRPFIGWGNAGASRWMAPSTVYEGSIPSVPQTRSSQW